MHTIRSLNWLLILCLISSCSVRHVAFGRCDTRIQTAECYQNAPVDADLVANSFAAADQLILNADLTAAPQHARLLVTTIADINNLEDSTPLGRLLGEQLSTRLAQQGYTVIEAKLGSGLTVIPRTGEFVLSRAIREIGRQHNANSAVTGTYAVGQTQVYVTLKLVDCQDGRILSSHAYSLPIGPNTQALLRDAWWW
ncbi:MAG: FlgO family outer membrane protein [Pseudomonadota bacterium]|nr:FlgO family outer membrane protein [Pseudomonadota bacterium]